MDRAPQQLPIVQAPLDRKIVLVGPAGAGKTTAGVARMRYLLDAGIPADTILVLVPQRTLATPYVDALRSPELAAGGLVNVATVGGLARRMIDLFWPLVVEEAGFGLPDERPVFLTLETAQYYMAHVVGPLIEARGYFETVTIDRNRLYSQILDNLNKSAVVGFPHIEIAERLKAAWVGEKAQTRVYDEAQECATHFRRYCLTHNLLDFSLQLELFVTHLWPEPLCRDYLLETYRHLIFDNAEEDTPVAHDLVYTWLPHTTSALVIMDQDAGYRSFLGADPESASALADLCDERVVLTTSYVNSPEMAAFSAAMTSALTRTPSPNPVISSEASNPTPTNPVISSEASNPSPTSPLPLRFENHRYYPEMLDWVADEIAALVRDEGCPPNEIVVLAPFLSDALRFSLSHRLALRDVPVRSHRPSRALRDEPATRTLLTLAEIAHPNWGFRPTRYDVAYALMQTIAELDLVRAQLLANILYRVQDGLPHLAPFDAVNPDMQQRITFILGGRYEALRMWIASYGAAKPVALDHFLSRLFGEMLSQPGYGFHRDLDSARVVSMLVESVRKFRWIVRGPAVSGVQRPVGTDAAVVKPLGQEYLEMVRDGVIAAQYISRWQTQTEDAVLLAPAYTYLLSNRPVDVQFWLNVGGHGWWERLYQPLTHPYVLSRHWPPGQPWTDEEEYALRQASLHRLVLGLVRRCRKAVYLGLSDLGERGYEQEGPLLRAIQRVLRTRTTPA